MSSGRIRLGMRVLLSILAFPAIGAAGVWAEDVLHVSGLEGTYLASNETVCVVGGHNDAEVQVVGDATGKWLSKAKAAADMIYSSADTMKVHRWRRADILPEVRIVARVCRRIVELECQSCVYLRP